MEYSFGRITELVSCEEEECVEKAILNVLKEHNLSLSQVRGVFQNILYKIEDKNVIDL